MCPGSIIAYRECMVRHLTLVLVLGIAACGVGGGGDDGSNTGSGSGKTPPTDQVAVCAATLAVSGTFTVGTGLTLDPAGGCQPAGSWAVTVAVADQGTCTAVPVKTSFAYTVTGAARETQLTYSAAAGEDFSGAVEATGGGTCEGSFDHVVKDGTKFDEINLHPALAKVTDAAQTTLTISGSGTYNLWDAHP